MIPPVRPYIFKRTFNHGGSLFAIRQKAKSELCRFLFERKGQTPIALHKASEVQ
jgi:hypothetical protein